MLVEENCLSSTMAAMANAGRKGGKSDLEGVVAGDSDEHNGQLRRE